MNHAEILRSVLRDIEYKYISERKSDQSGDPDDLWISYNEYRVVSDATIQMLNMIYEEEYTFTPIRWVEIHFPRMQEGNDTMTWDEYNQKVNMLVQQFSAHADEHMKDPCTHKTRRGFSPVRKSLHDMVHMICKATYPSLPEELKPYYVYLLDSGHCLCCVPEESTKEHPDSNEWDNYEIPAPVKYVLENGYRIFNEYLIVDAPYDPEIGLNVPEEYSEYSYKAEHDEF